KIIEINDLNAKTVELNYFSKKEGKDEFITIVNTQYYDDNISIRIIEDQILYYQIFNEIDSEFGLIINKKKSSIIIKNKQVMEKHLILLHTLFDSQNIIVIP